MKCPSYYSNTLEVHKSVCSLPEIFVFVLNRDKNSKVRNKIKFPQLIDMHEFYEPVKKQYEIHNTVYELICEAIEIDGYSFAICKNYNDNKYYNFNDNMVRRVENFEVFRTNPYILFYENKK